MEQQTMRRSDDSPLHCPSCGGAMHFDPASGRQLCPECGATREIPARLPAGQPIASEQDFTLFEERGSHGWGAALYEYTCKSCGKKTLTLSQTGAACPACGGETREAKAAPLAPNAVCPMKLSREQAEALLKTHFKKQLFTPGALKRSIRAESLVGSYLPGWIFTTETIVKYTGSFGVDRADKDRYGRVRTATDWYPVSGTYVEDFENQLEWAFDTVEPALLKGLEPYRTEDCRAYDPAYLGGFSTECNRLPLPDAWKTARKAMEGTLFDNLRYQILTDKNAHRVNELKFTTAYTGLSCQSLLLPVWILNFPFHGKIHSIFINGETGKISGKPPVSVPRVILAALLGVAVLVGLLLWAGR